jgi:hypothetical protein
VRPPPFRRVAVVALVLGGLFAVAYWWVDSGRRMFVPRRWGVVAEGRIYRSGLLDERLVERTLRSHGIATIVDLSGETVKDPDLAVEPGGLAGDGTGDEAAYVVAVEEMVRAPQGKPVLVHCVGGSERTGAAVAFYRLLFDGWSGPRAYEEYLDYRRHPPPDDRLVRFVNDHMGSLAARLVADGVLASVPSPLPRFGPE